MTIIDDLDLETMAGEECVEVFAPYGTPVAVAAEQPFVFFESAVVVISTSENDDPPPTPGRYFETYKGRPVYRELSKSDWPYPPEEE